MVDDVGAPGNAPTPPAQPEPESIDALRAPGLPAQPPNTDDPEPAELKNPETASLSSQRELIIRWMVPTACILTLGITLGFIFVNDALEKLAFSAVSSFMTFLAAIAGFYFTRNNGDGS